MKLRLAGGMLTAFACAVGFLVLCSRAEAAPRVHELWAEVPITEPSGGFVGKVQVSPASGPAGTAVAVKGEGFPAEQELQLVWRTVKGRWKVTPAEFHGRE